MTKENCCFEIMVKSNVIQGNPMFLNITYFLHYVIDSIIILVLWLATNTHQNKHHFLKRVFYFTEITHRNSIVFFTLV